MFSGRDEEEAFGDLGVSDPPARVSKDLQPYRNTTRRLCVWVCAHAGQTMSCAQVPAYALPMYFSAAGKAILA